jgi:hypothetical protein
MASQDKPSQPNDEASQAKAEANNKAGAREAILRRRMFFVSSALMLTGCPQDPQQPATGTSKPVATIPTVSASAVEPAPTSAPPAPTVTVPSLDVPADVSEVARSHFERLKEMVPQIHAELDAADKSLLARCSIEDAVCDPTWQSVAKNLAEARDLRADLPARCSGTSADAKRFEASLAEHLAAIDARLDGLEKRIEGLLNSDSKKAKWTAHVSGAAMPRPCLKYRCDDW